jgi:hypothetical protein
MTIDDIEIIEFGDYFALVYNDNEDTAIVILPNKNGFYVPEFQRQYKFLDDVKLDYIKYLHKYIYN